MVWFVPGQHAIQVPPLKCEACSASSKWVALVMIFVSRHNSFSFLISSISRETPVMIAQTCPLLSNPARTSTGSPT